MGVVEGKSRFNIEITFKVKLPLYELYGIKYTGMYFTLIFVTFLGVLFEAAVLLLLLTLVALLFLSTAAFFFLTS